MEKCILDSDWTGARNPDRDIFLVAIGQEDARAGRGVKFNGPLQPSFSERIWPNAGGRGRGGKGRCKSYEPNHIPRTTTMVFLPYLRLLKCKIARH